MTEDVEAKFLEDIRLNPDDDELRRVYADWLEQRGDPRGEYLRLELLLRRAPGRIAELAAMLDPSWMRAVGCRYALALVPPVPQKISAIKLVRELANIGLKDAKDLVESASLERPAIVVPDLDREVAERLARRFEGAAGTTLVPVVRARPLGMVTVEVVAVADGKKLEAIKRVRDLTGIGLREAKDFVENVLAGQPRQLGMYDAERARDLQAQFAGCAEVRLV